MEKIPDPYRELGVLRGATDAQVKAAHRRLAKRFHPDAPEGDHDRFLAIQEAYQLLSDPLRRRDWDTAHAPGPVRAGDPAKPRPRGSGAPPRARSAGSAGSRAGSGGAAGGRRGGAAGAGAGSGGSAGSAGATGSAGAAGESERAGAAWSASDREPASRSTTWSASGVPWWEDFAPRDRSAASAPGAAGTGTAGSAGSAGAGAGGAGRAKGRAAGSRGSGTAGGSGAGAGSGAPAGSGAAGSGAGDAATSGRTTAQRSPEDIDVYSRSSGAAWSMAARRYFRKGEAELPKGGAWTYRGTQVVTGAEARKVAAEQAAELRRAADREAAESRHAAERQAAERRRAADDLLRSRAPGPTSGSRQAFSHESDRPAAPKPAAPPPPPSTRPASSRPVETRVESTPPAPASAPTLEPSSSLIGRVRRALGLR